MAITIARSGRMYVGDKRRVWGTIALDTSYVTGGYVYTNPQLELSTVDMFTINPQGGVLFEIDYTNKKVKCFWGDYNNAADGVFTEIDNATNLSGVTGARWEAWGF